VYGVFVDDEGTNLTRKNDYNKGFLDEKIKTNEKSNRFCFVIRERDKEERNCSKF